LGGETGADTRKEEGSSSVVLGQFWAFDGRKQRGLGLYNEGGIRNLRTELLEGAERESELLRNLTSFRTGEKIVKKGPEGLGGGDRKSDWNEKITFPLWGAYS